MVKKTEFKNKVNLIVSDENDKSKVYRYALTHSVSLDYGIQKRLIDLCEEFSDKAEELIRKSVVLSFEEINVMFKIK